MMMMMMMNKKRPASSPRKSPLNDSPKLNVKQPRRSFASLESATAVVNRSIEDGQQSVDLSYLALESVPENIGSLRFLVGVVHGSGRLDSRLSIALHSNRLTQLSRNLCSLENLVVLNLWNNQLAELPPAIAQLGALDTLIVGRNQLTCVSGELLQLRRLKRLGLHPNPLLTNNNDDEDEDENDDGNNRKDVDEDHDARPSLRELAARAVIMAKNAQNINHEIPNAMHDMITNHISKIDDCQQCGRVPLVREWHRVVRWQSVCDNTNVPMLFRFCGKNCASLFMDTSSEPVLQLSPLK